MSLKTFLIIFTTIQVTFVPLDFIDRHLSRKSRYEGDKAACRYLQTCYPATC